MVRANDNTETSSARAESGLGAYLRACRAQITPERVGLQPTSGSRRAFGLRREEVAALAGISIDYYVRLERGREAHPSQSVLDSLARALLLDDREHRHLCELAAVAQTCVTRSGSSPADAIRPGVLVMIRQLRPNPVFVLSRTLDVLAATPSAVRLFAGLDAQPPGRRNLVRYVFLHPLARQVLADWDEQARSCVARLRKLAGMDPGAPDLAELIGELLPKKPEFTELWDRFDIKPHMQGLRTFRHPEVGEVRLGWESMPLTDSPAQTLVVFYADPDDGPDRDRMVLLDIGHGQPGANDDRTAGRTRQTA